MFHFAIIQRTNSAPELHTGESMLQELGIVIEKPFVQQKTTDSQPIRKHGDKQHHSSFEVLFDGTNAKVSYYTFQSMSSYFFVFCHYIMFCL